MKKALILGLLFLAGCSSAPKRILMKDCEEAGKNSGLFYCNPIPQKDITGRK